MARHAAMFEAVYADPDNDIPRQILADALTKERDPRGLFITTQLARARGEKVSKDAAVAERSALKAHAKAWLEPLGDALVASSVKWERGFPSEGRLNLTGSAWKRRPEGKPHPLRKIRALATLRSLKVTSPNTLVAPDEVREIIAMPELRRLRAVDGLNRVLIPELANADLPYGLRYIKCQQQGGGGLEGEEAEKRERKLLHAAFAKGGKGLPDLVDLEMPWSHGADQPEDYAWLWDTAIGRHLEVLRLDGYYFAKVLSGWHKALTAERSAGLSLRAVHTRAKWTMALHRTNNKWRKLTGDLGGAAFAKRELNELIELCGGQGAFDEIAVEGI
jgi:hypothetical protein